MGSEIAFGVCVVFGLIGTGVSVFRLIVAFTLNEEELRAMKSPWPLVSATVLALGVGFVHFAFVLANIDRLSFASFSIRVATWLVAETILGAVLVLIGLWFKSEIDETDETIENSKMVRRA